MRGECRSCAGALAARSLLPVQCSKDEHDEHSTCGKGLTGFGPDERLNEEWFGIYNTSYEGGKDYVIEFLPRPIVNELQVRNSDNFEKGITFQIFAERVGNLISFHVSMPQQPRHGQRGCLVQGGGKIMQLHHRAYLCIMFCFTLVQCSLLLCLSWTILSTKMHLHIFPLLKMLCKTMKFFHRLKMRKNVVSLLLPNDRRLAEIMVAKC